jgi:hypothetical protein
MIDSDLHAGQVSADGLPGSRRQFDTKKGVLGQHCSNDNRIGAVDLWRQTESGSNDREEILGHQQEIDQ